jgi:signal peptidase
MVRSQRQASASTPKNKRKLKRALQWLATLCLAAIILLGVAILVAPHFGWRFDAVYSGSMEPAIHVGSMAVVSQVDLATIRDGDVITFASHDKADSFVTHRVVGVTNDGRALLFRTKGDANDAPDEDSVRASDVVGKVRLSIPYAGYVADFLQKPLGFGLVIGLPALLIILFEARNISVAARDLRRKNRRKQTVKAETEQGAE